MGGDGRGNPLPKGQGGVDGGVVGSGRERPLPLPLQDERPPSSGIHNGNPATWYTPTPPYHSSHTIVMSYSGAPTSSPPLSFIFKIHHCVKQGPGSPTNKNVSQS